MPDFTDVNEMIAKIEVEKELLSIMPKNNNKNKEKYLEKLSQLKEDYTKYGNTIEEVLKKRYKKAVDIKTNNGIENLDVRINTIESVLYLLSDEKTSYEKMGLDKIIYKIGRYYRANLENINEQIAEAIKKFKNVEIDLSVADFNYSTYVEEYMKVFFNELKNGDIKSSNLKTKFEEIYWKCPDIIIHIELNIRNIYFQKENQIDKYFEKEKKQILKQWDKNTTEIIKTYIDLKDQKMQMNSQDKKQLLEKFIEGKLKTEDYTEDKIQGYYNKMLTSAIIKNIETEQEEIKNGIFSFLNSLYEYKNYMFFEFIINDVKKYYKERERYKKVYEDTKKKIAENEKKLKKITKKASSCGIFKKVKKEVKHSAEQNQIIMEIKKTYKELDLNKFYNKIYSNIEENTTIYEVLNLANSYYNYLALCMIENNKTITEEKIDEQIKRLDNFLKNPYNNIINNLTISDEKDISMIIKDRYKLLNFNIKQEDLTDKNIDGVIAVLEKILTSFELKKTKLKIHEIEEIIQLRDIFNIK